MSTSWRGGGASLARAAAAQLPPGIEFPRVYRVLSYALRLLALLHHPDQLRNNEATDQNTRELSSHPPSFSKQRTRQDEVRRSNYAVPGIGWGQLRWSLEDDGLVQEGTRLRQDISEDIG